MASSTIRKAIGTMKDQTSIGLAKVSSTIAPDLNIAIVKATSHEDEPSDEKHIHQIINTVSYSRGYASACVSTISRRLDKTRDWIVALKTLMLVHRLLTEGLTAFHHELLYATRRGTRLLNMSDFRDEAHSSSWDHSAFVRAYAFYLDLRLECINRDYKQIDSPREQQRSLPFCTYSCYSNPDLYRRNPISNFTPTQGEERRPGTPLRERNLENVLGWMNQLQQLFDRLLACRPIGLAKSNRMIVVALYPIIRESFQLYAHICEILDLLLDRFFEMEHSDCVKSFEAYASAAKQIDELYAFYGWCKSTGVARSSEFPEVQRITDKLLEMLQEFKKDRATRPNSPLRHAERALTVQEEEPVRGMNVLKAIPAPSDYEDKAEQNPQSQPQFLDVLVDLREDDGTADAQGLKLASALFFSGAAGTGNWTWEAFSSSDVSGKGNATSVCERPDPDEGNADWELALVEAAGKLAKQKTALGGGIDPLLLNGMHDHGAVRQLVSAHASIGSANSVDLLVPVLALPASDGIVQNIGGDPFAASLSIPPPSYVQMSDFEKTHLQLLQERQLWHRHTQGGMLEQASLAKHSNAH
ncbi:probable clathrin assembly protein At4g32285 [Phalaenopsis equestris]|uniref:probable clathrin assembly protein At4g32285 n=1 Tax=Phalaenopsis equestris TaxID=78828 RepID=UPI0009E55B9D|nr:probable clathrin assembly protein At4g32285 [Phalaenopsis equestris]